MKQLLLIRHAKSSWDFPGCDDHDRVLNQRGEEDAPRMGAALAQRGVQPDLMVSSTAVRARTTAGIVAEALAYADSQIQEERDLYLASPRTILRIVQQLDEACDTALLFGHNPGMHEAVGMLAGGATVDHFPTLAVARIELDVEHWGCVEPGDGLLVEILTPKLLKRG